MRYQRPVLTTAISLFASFAIVGVTYAADAPKTELLWPKGAPGAKGDQAADKPTLTDLPAQAGACQRRGDRDLSRRRLRRTGRRSRRPAGGRVAQFVWRGRLHPRISPSRPRLSSIRRPCRTPNGRSARSVPARRSSRSIRKRIGILGFSAGGHLASTAGTHFDRGDPSAAGPDRAGKLPAGLHGALLRGHRLRRTLHPSRLADESARQESAAGTGAKSLQREAGDERHAADVPRSTPTRTPPCPRRTACSSTWPCARRDVPAELHIFRPASTASAWPRKRPARRSGRSAARTGCGARGF